MTTTAETCPACGKPTLNTVGREQICEACGWQDDPVSRRDADANSPDNGISLKQARWNVEQFGIAFPPSEAGV